jgi:hypothetical protein
MAGEAVPTIPAASGFGPLSGQAGTIALALTAFLLVWQICLLGVAARVLHYVRDAANVRDIIIIG